MKRKQPLLQEWITKPIENLGLKYPRFSLSSRLKPDLLGTFMVQPSTLGMLYHLSFQSPMQTPHIYVTEDNVTHLSTTLPYEPGHELKLGCFMHCHDSPEVVALYNDRNKLLNTRAKIERCIHFAESYRLIEPTRVGKSLAVTEQTRDRLLLIKIEEALRYLPR